MLSLALAVALTAPASVHLLPKQELQLTVQMWPSAPLTLTQMTVQALEERTEAPRNGWTGETGRRRVTGICLTAGGGTLGLVSLILFATAASTGSYRTTSPYYPYTTQVYASPWPYVIGGLLTMAGAGLGLGFGIPMILDTLPAHSGQVAPVEQEQEQVPAPKPKAKRAAGTV